jgi:hypothetical protein
MASATPPKPPKPVNQPKTQVGASSQQTPASQGDPRKVFNDFASI